MQIPIILSDDLNLVSNAVLMPEEGKLKNPFKTPMLIEEVRFGLELNDRGEGGTIRARMNLTGGGKTRPVTNDFVPIWNFPRQQNGMLQDDLNVSAFVWRLPKPLLVLPHEYLTCDLKNVVMFSDTSDYDVRVSYVGRSLPANYAVPATRAVPWVTAFIADAAATGSSNTTQRSKTTDLFNPFSELLNVSYFTGRCSVRDGGSPSEALSASTVQAAEIITYRTLVRMTDQRGQIVVRDNTPFGVLFHTIDRAWTVNATLASRGFYTVDLTLNYATLASGLTSAPMIGMVGYREEAL